MKQQIYNLIILDESGSMSGITAETISGCNETIQSIKMAQQKHADTQEHYVSIYAFQSGDGLSRYIIKDVLSDKVKEITGKDYRPGGCTPLNDAVGTTLMDLKAKTKSVEDAIGSVTIITDGMENSSKEYTTAQVAKMIEELKALGWNFNFIGANIDVEGTASRYNIDNRLKFTQSSEGTSKMFYAMNRGRNAYYDRIALAYQKSSGRSKEERQKAYRMAEADYFDARASHDGRVTPYHVKQLSRNEVFVFGSNLQGAHGGGAARLAVEKFGAVMGQGVGLQGQSYAIPTMQGGVETIKPYVDDFIEYAKANPNLKFLVTRIGCGIAGFDDRDIAPLFVAAKDVENISLPQSFWNVIDRL